MSLKTDVIASLDQLPNKASYMDIQYNLYVMNKIKQGQESIKNKGGIEHCEAAKRLKKWLIK
jgi:hypothetical protein